MSKLYHNYDKYNIKIEMPECFKRSVQQKEQAERAKEV